MFDLAAVRKRWARRLTPGLQRQRRRRPARRDPGAVPRRRLPVDDPLRQPPRRGDVDLPAAWRVNPDPALIARLKEWLQPANVQVVYQAA